uniref:Uncharacterized protein n=1 Tax=Rhipicephalus microplus TaxID=6941 RepID=A0A6G5A289_RHIMP
MSNTRTQLLLSTCTYCTSYSVMTVTLQPNTVAPKHSRNIMYIQTNTVTKGFLWLLLSSKAIASEVVTYHYITSSHLWQLKCKMYASLCIEKNSDFLFSHCTWKSQVVLVVPSATKLADAVRRR